MGLFSKLKDLFNKNIECDEILDGHIVFPFKKKKYIYINKNILVRDNSACVIVYKHKVCDVLNPGKYKINEENFPETFYKAKIKKANKHGRNVKKIKTDIYFVNTQEIKNFEFISDMPFILKSEGVGKVVGYLQGTCELRIIDPEKIVKALIAESGKAKLDEVKQDIGLWIGNKINKTIEKQKLNIQVVLKQQDYAQKILNTCLEDGYDNIGVFIKNIKLKAVDFSKKSQKKINDYMTTRSKPVFNFNFNSTIENNVSIGVQKQTSNMQYNQNNTMQSLNKIGNMGDFKYCSNCGTKIPSSAKYCNKCGKQC